MFHSNLPLMTAPHNSFVIKNTGELLSVVFYVQRAWQSPSRKYAFSSRPKAEVNI